MAANNPLNDSPHLQNLGIDHDMITRHAGDMNREFNRMYQEHVMNGGASLQSTVTQTAPAAPMPQVEQPQQQAPVQQQTTAVPQQDASAMHSSLQQALQSNVQAQNATLEKFMKHMVDEQQKMMNVIEQLQSKIETLQTAAPAQPVEQVQTQVEQQPEAASAPQQAPQQSSEPEQITGTHKDSDETTKLREQVSIENMFNFSGVGKSQAKRI